MWAQCEPGYITCWFIQVEIRMKSVRKIKISMAERVKRDDLNRLLPSSTELKRLRMQTKEKERGDLLPTKKTS